jgi:hypothetical protein
MNYYFWARNTRNAQNTTVFIFRTKSSGTRVFCAVRALFVIVTVPVIAVGAGSARPNMVQTTDCTDSHRLLFFGTEYTERTEYHGFYF